MQDEEPNLRGLKAGESFAADNPEDFAESLELRRQAADGLEDDLLNDVPMLYGSPGNSFYPASPDPGIVLARIHREEMLRKNGYDVSDASGTPSEVSLPFERSIGALVLLLMLIVVFSNATHGH